MTQHVDVGQGNSGLRQETFLNAEIYRFVSACLDMRFTNRETGIAGDVANINDYINNIPSDVYESPPGINENEVCEMNLFNGSYWGDSNAVSTALEHHIDINKRDLTGRTALHHASHSGSIEVVRLLLANGAKVNERDLKNWNPILIAVSRGHLTVAKELLASGADPRSSMQHNCAPTRNHFSTSECIHFAAIRGNREIVDLLCQYGVGICTVDGSMRTPLHYASVKGPLGFIEFIVSKGGEIMAIDENKRTCLHLAVMTNKMNVISYFVRMGALINSKDVWDMTAIDLALVNKRYDVVKFLRKAQHASKVGGTLWISDDSSRNRFSVYVRPRARDYNSKYKNTLKINVEVPKGVGVSSNHYCQPPRQPPRQTKVSLPTESPKENIKYDGLAVNGNGVSERDCLLDANEKLLPRLTKDAMAEIDHRDIGNCSEAQAKKSDLNRMDDCNSENKPGNINVADKLDLLDTCDVQQDTESPTSYKKTDQPDIINSIKRSNCGDVSIRDKSIQIANFGNSGGELSTKSLKEGVCFSDRMSGNSFQVEAIDSETLHSKDVHSDSTKLSSTRVTSVLSTVENMTHSGGQAHMNNLNFKQTDPKSTAVDKGLKEEWAKQKKADRKMKSNVIELKLEDKKLISSEKSLKPSLTDTLELKVDSDVRETINFCGIDQCRIDQRMQTLCLNEKEKVFEKMFPKLEMTKKPVTPDENKSVKVYLPEPNSSKPIENYTNAAIITLNKDVGQFPEGYHRDNSNIKKVATAIATALKETSISQISRSIHRIGVPRCFELLSETLEIEQAGGKLVEDGSRRKTSGGIFFSLLKKSLIDTGARDDWRYIRQEEYERRKARNRAKS